MTQQSLLPLPALELRDYQQEALDKLLDYRRAGGSRALVVMATGSGKTVLFAQMPRFARKSVLVLAHREELLDQSAQKIQWANPQLQVEVEQADRHATQGAQVVVASVQTLAVSQKRLAALDPGRFSSVIVDESHHTPAASYVRILSHFGLAPDLQGIKDSAFTQKNLSHDVREALERFRPAPGAPFLSGFTATPGRTDRRGLEYFYDDIVFSRTIQEMIEAGWLCRIRGVQVRTGTDISGVKVSHGEYAEEDLSREVNTPERNALAVHAYLDHAKGRQTLVFCVNVQHAEDMLTAFEKAKIPSALVVGSTPSQERRRTVAAYQDGQVQVLVGVMVFTEGFDAPATSCIIMARPTRSSLVYTQAIGRGTRISPGKPDLVVIDLVDIQKKTSIQNLNTMFGLPPYLKVEREEDGDVLEAAKRAAEMQEALPLEVYEGAESLADLQRLAREFDPLRSLTVEPWIEEASRFMWIKTSFGYALSLGNHGQFGIVEDLLGGATLKRKEPGHPTHTLGHYHQTQEAIKYADSLAEAQAGDALNLIKRDSRWRKESPSEKQVAFLKKHGITVPSVLTKGQASQLIDQKLQESNTRRPGRFGGWR